MRESSGNHKEVKCKLRGYAIHQRVTENFLTLSGNVTKLKWVHNCKSKNSDISVVTLLK